MLDALLKSGKKIEELQDRIVSLRSKISPFEQLLDDTDILYHTAFEGHAYAKSVEDSIKLLKDRLREMHDVADPAKLQGEEYENARKKLEELQTKARSLKQQFKSGHKPIDAPDRQRLSIFSEPVMEEISPRELRRNRAASAKPEVEEISQGQLTQNMAALIKLHQEAVDTVIEIQDKIAGTTKKEVELQALSEEVVEEEERLLAERASRRQILKPEEMIEIPSAQVQDIPKLPQNVVDALLKSKGISDVDPTSEEAQVHAKTALLGLLSQRIVPKVGGVELIKEPVVLKYLIKQSYFPNPKAVATRAVMRIIEQAPQDDHDKVLAEYGVTEKEYVAYSERSEASKEIEPSIKEAQLTEVTFLNSLRQLRNQLRELVKAGKIPPDKMHLVEKLLNTDDLESLLPLDDSSPQALKDSYFSAIKGSTYWAILREMVVHGPEYEKLFQSIGGDQAKTLQNGFSNLFQRGIKHKNLLTTMISDLEKVAARQKEEGLKKEAEETTQMIAEVSVTQHCVLQELALTQERQIEAEATRARLDPTTARFDIADQGLTAALQLMASLSEDQREEFPKDLYQDISPQIKRRYENLETQLTARSEAIAEVLKERQKEAVKALKTNKGEIDPVVQKYHEDTQPGGSLYALAEKAELAKQELAIVKAKLALTQGEAPSQKDLAALSLTKEQMVGRAHQDLETQLSEVTKGIPPSADRRKAAITDIQNKSIKLSISGGKMDRFGWNYDEVAIKLRKEEFRKVQQESLKLLQRQDKELAKLDAEIAKLESEGAKKPSLFSLSPQKRAAQIKELTTKRVKLQASFNRNVKIAEANLEHAYDNRSLERALDLQVKKVMSQAESASVDSGIKASVKKEGQDLLRQMDAIGFIKRGSFGDELVDRTEAIDEVRTRANQYIDSTSEYGWGVPQVIPQAVVEDVGGIDWTRIAREEAQATQERPAPRLTKQEQQKQEIAALAIEAEQKDSADLRDRVAALLEKRVAIDAVMTKRFDTQGEILVLDAPVEGIVEQFKSLANPIAKRKFVAQLKLQNEEIARLEKDLDQAILEAQRALAEPPPRRVSEARGSVVEEPSEKDVQADVERAPELEEPVPGVSARRVSREEVPQPPPRRESVLQRRGSAPSAEPKAEQVDRGEVQGPSAEDLEEPVQQQVVEVNPEEVVFGEIAEEPIVAKRAPPPVSQKQMQKLQQREQIRAFERAIVNSDIDTSIQRKLEPLVGLLEGQRTATHERIAKNDAAIQQKKNTLEASRAGAHGITGLLSGRAGAIKKLEKEISALEEQNQRLLQNMDLAIEVAQSKLKREVAREFLLRQIVSLDNLYQFYVFNWGNPDSIIPVPPAVQKFKNLQSHCLKLMEQLVELDKDEAVIDGALSAMREMEESAIELRGFLRDARVEQVSSIQISSIQKSLRSSAAIMEALPSPTELRDVQDGWRAWVEDIHPS